MDEETKKRGGEERKKQRMAEVRLGKTGDDGEKKQQIWREVQPRDRCFLFFSSLDRAHQPCSTKIRVSLKLLGPLGGLLNCESR